MTYIEFFDKTSLENVCACLTDTPERVIFVGDDEELMNSCKEDYKKVFSKRHKNIEFLCRKIMKGNVDNIIEVLTKIINEYENCVFGITGGDEMLTLALGIVYERYSHKNIQIHKFGIEDNRIFDCDKDGNTVYKETPKLTVKENVQIYGGDIAVGDIWENKTYLWDMNADFLKDIETMWTICKYGVGTWNTQITVFEAIDKVGSVTNNGMTVTANVSDLRDYMAKSKISYRMIFGIINKLRREGLLTAYVETQDQISVSYKNEQVRKCLTKAGQVLEMKIYATARTVKNAEGVPVYHDVMNGVVIDWDGVLHEKNEKFFDTKNEIDVLLMKDMIPIFISCKNGSFDMEELYKLNTVAERFGGKYSKKVLVATRLSKLGETGKYIRQRAKDMDIYILEDVKEMDDTILEAKLRNL